MEAFKKLRATISAVERSSMANNCRAHFLPLPERPWNIAWVARNVDQLRSEAFSLIADNAIKQRDEIKNPYRLLYHIGSHVDSPYFALKLHDVLT